MKLFSEIMTKGLGRQVLTLRKHSPSLFFVGGVVGMVGSTVLACRATLKLDEALEANKRKAEAVKEYQGDGYSEEDRKEDTAILYVRSVVTIAKLYAPAVLLGSASVAMLTQSHNLLVKRNAALTAAYAALDQGFRDYRARVVAKYGPNEDERLRYGDEKVTIKDEETGKNKTVDRVGPEGASIYAKFFDQFNPNWSKDPEINKLFLRSQQNYLNNLLHARGHVFLNEVYESLGFDHTKAGSVVGWILLPNNDNFIDFGVFHSNVDDRIRDFVNGREGAVLLDFNVDGLIYDKIDERKERLSWQKSS
jgi:Family of unknown function (DUF6353)